MLVYNSVYSLCSIFSSFNSFFAYSRRAQPSGVSLVIIYSTRGKSIPATSCPKYKYDIRYHVFSLANQHNKSHIGKNHTVLKLTLLYILSAQFSSRYFTNSLSSHFFRARRYNIIIIHCDNGVIYGANHADTPNFHSINNTSTLRYRGFVNTVTTRYCKINMNVSNQYCNLLNI